MHLATKHIKIRNLDLRDGHQSYFATRMTTEQIKDVLPDILDVGYFGLEVWGGATLDSAMRYLKEDPWERLAIISEITNKRTHLTALARGINLFGYNPYPDSVVENFNKTAVKTGVTVMRVFDALNDLNNLKSTIKAVKEANGLIDCAICYTTNPVFSLGEKIAHFFKKGHFPKAIFNVDYFVNKAIELEKMGADIITIKDMAGLIHPKMSYDLIKALKEKVKVPINLHSHCTPGYGVTSLVAGMMAGVDILDAVSYPFSGGPSHPAVEIINEYAKLLDMDLGLNEDALPRVRRKLEKVRRELSQFDEYKQYNYVFSGKFTDEQSSFMKKSIEFLMKKDYENALKMNHKLEASLGLPEPDEPVRQAQIPGGMYSNMLSQLKEAKILHLLHQVLKEVPKVRINAGNVPLVTPTSQIVGVQAVNNVMSRIQGKKDYSNLTKQYEKLVRGEYGETPIPISPDFREQLIGSREEKRFDVSVWKHAEAPSHLVKDDKDQMLLDLFPGVALEYLEYREKQSKIQEENETKAREYYSILNALSDNYLI